MKNLSDNEILESIKRGNQADFSLLIDRYKDRAYSLLKGLLKNSMDAEEALQDSFLKVYNSLENFRFESKFSTWFYRIVYNTGLTVLTNKKRKVEKEMNSIEDISYLINDEPGIYSESENASVYLLKVIDLLPVRNAVVLILFYMDGLTINEISNVMDLSLVNCKVLLHRSRNILRDLLLKYNYIEEIV